MKKQKLTLEFLFEGINATLKEIERFSKEKAAETDLQFKKSREEHDLQFKKSREEHDRLFKETDQLIKGSAAKVDKYQEAYEKRMAKMEENMGNWSNNHGSFAEEYFFNSFENEQQNFFGEHFNDIDKNLKPPKKNNLKDEYDIVMYNDSYVAIVESKFKAHKNDIPKVIKKAETFRILCPDYKDYRIYLGLASLSFNDELEHECMEQGIAVIKQVGDMVVIRDENLKVF
jgi:hypothetical protein